MKIRKKRGSGYEEVSYWQSYSDMMAALLLIFILIIAITLAVYKQKKEDLETTQSQLATSQTDLQNSLDELEEAYEQATMTQEELDKAYKEIDENKKQLDAAQSQLDTAQAELDETKSELKDIVGIRTDIIGQLQSTFQNSSMKVDAQTGSITFSTDVLFKYNSSLLSDESKESLKEVIPLYLSVLLQDEFRPYIAEIIVEGHTDTDGDYQSNMTLSFNRANAVAKFCLNSDNGLSQDQTEKLKSLLTVNGRSFSDPIYKDGTDTVDMAASRRVEIKFRLKEDEMINKITEVLDEEQ